MNCAAKNAIKTKMKLSEIAPFASLSTCNELYSVFCKRELYRYDEYLEAPHFCSLSSCGAFERSRT